MATQQRHYSARSPSYYALLGVRLDAPAVEIRSAYRRLAMKWHPDRLQRQSFWVLEEAKRRFQLIQEAYQVLSDTRKRALYDIGLRDPLGEEEEEEEVEGFSEFLQEMVALMASEKTEGKEYTLVELQHTLADMARGFTATEDSRSSKRFRCDTNFTCTNVSAFRVGSH